MATFFLIFGLLIAGNVVLLLHNNLFAKARSKASRSALPEQPSIRIYSLDWFFSYKRAV